VIRSNKTGTHVLGLIMQLIFDVASNVSRMLFHKLDFTFLDLVKSLSRLLILQTLNPNQA